MPPTSLSPQELSHQTPERRIVALVGRPNVGKSTLLNRLIGRRKAVVSSLRGTTRDRVYGETSWRGVPLTLIDTGGFEFAKATTGLAAAVQRHLHQAVEQAERFVVICDAKEGFVAADQMVIDYLRTTGKPLIVAVNKVDDRPIVPPEFFALGVELLLPISALHGHGTGRLLDLLTEEVPAGVRSGTAKSEKPAMSPRPPQTTVAIAIVGRQNVGKSSLLNALLREERAIVSEMPGTTRDVVDTLLSLHGESVLLIDTAGLRHRRKVKSPIDLFSMARTLEAIWRCDVALLVLDATQVLEVGCGLVVLANKWDLVVKGNEGALTERVHRLMPFASFAPVIATSAKTGFQVQRALTMARHIQRLRRRGLPEGACTGLLQRAWRSHTPPRFRGRAIQLRQARWLPGRPATIELTTSPIGRLPAPYQHYLLNQLHAHPQLVGMPIRLLIKGPAPR